MTREDIVNTMSLEDAIQVFRDTNCYGTMDIAKTVILRALEQETILDKIRAEIEQAFCKVENDYDHGRNYGLYMTTQIIDKYRKEQKE